MYNEIIVVTLQTIESTTLPVDQRTRVELFYIYTFYTLRRMASPTLTYTHQALSVTDIVARLKDKGLAFADEEEAIKWLRVISYFRFTSYLRPFERVGTDHEFKPPVSSRLWSY